MDNFLKVLFFNKLNELINYNFLYGILLYNFEKIN